MHCCTRWNTVLHCTVHGTGLNEHWKNAGFIYTRNKGMRYVRITLRCTIDTGD